MILDLYLVITVIIELVITMNIDQGLDTDKMMMTLRLPLAMMLDPELIMTLIL